MTQKELLEKVYLSEKSVASLRKWENGDRLPDLETLARMSEVFDCDIGYLLGDYDEKDFPTHKICEYTGLSEKAIVCLQKMNPIAAWRNPLQRGGANNDSIFVKGPYTEKTHDLLNILITSEHFLNIFGEIGLYLIDAGELPEGFINKSRIELTRDEYEKFYNWMDWQNKIPYNKEEVAEMHLQLACDKLKEIYREVLQDRLEMRDKNG